MRIKTATLALTLAALLPGARAATAQATTCPLITAAQATISVDVEANASPDCLKVKKGKTSVVWKGSTAVKSLLIEFKDPASQKRPDNPVCAGALCTLEKAKHALKEGEFAYTVVVMRKDGTTATVDPKLIIEPLGP